VFSVSFFPPDPPSDRSMAPFSTIFPVSFSFDVIIKTVCKNLKRSLLLQFFFIDRHLTRAVDDFAPAPPSVSVIFPRQFIFVQLSLRYKWKRRFKILRWHLRVFICKMRDSYLPPRKLFSRIRPFFPPPHRSTPKL